MADTKIDRQTTTPFLLNLCYRQNGHHRLDEYPLPPSFALPRDRIQIYTWPSCSLQELTHLLTTALPSLLPSPAIGTRLSYRLVYPDAKDAYVSVGRPGGPQAKYLSKELGSVVVSAEGLADEENDTAAADRNGDKEEDTNGISKARLNGEPNRTLADARFVIGDFVSCAIFPPGANGQVAPPPPPVSAGPGSGRGRAYVPPVERRENGYYGSGGHRGSRGSSSYPRGGAGFGRLNDGAGGIPPGEWRRGERIPDEGYSRGQGRGRGRGW